MSIWDWVYEFDVKATLSGDTARATLFDRLSEALSERRADPDHALLLLEQGRAAARHLAEPRWELLFEHWILQTLLFGKHNHHAALGRAVQATVEVRRSAFGDFPQRVCLHEDLIYAYVGIDPHGHADLIEQSLTYMEAQLHPEVECHQCLLELRTLFELEMGRPEAALAGAMRYLALSQNAFHLMIAHVLLCRLAYQRQAWNDLLDWSTGGEVHSQAAGDPGGYQAELLAWEALALHHAGDQEAASQLAQRAASQVARLKEAVSPAYYEALCSYLEASGQLERALTLREQQIVEMESQGQQISNVRARVEQCRLLVALERPVADQLEAARNAARQLAAPTPFLARLAFLEGGTTE